MIYKGIHVDVEDLDALEFLTDRGRGIDHLCAMITLTPEQEHRLSAWVPLAKKIPIILRLNYGYVGKGTLPPNDPIIRTEFVRWVVNVVQGYPEFWGFIVGNEPNNPREHPPGFELTPSYVASLLSQITRELKGRPRIGFTPLDPYHPHGGGCIKWQQRLINELSFRMVSLAFYTFHLKTQWVDDILALESVRFTDPPLSGESMNFGLPLKLMFYTIRRQWAKPVVFGEVNPIRKVTQMNFEMNPSLYGWPDSPSLAHQFMRQTMGLMRILEPLIAPHPIFVIFYRWARDEWQLRKYPALDYMLQTA